MDPREEWRHTRVNPGAQAVATPVSPASDPGNLPHTMFVTHEGSTRVTLWRKEIRTVSQYTK